jgi:LmbE family N-acetylglucosaminyl deacetylase
MRVLAFHAHPDDIEFQLGGILLLLAQKGCEISCVTLCRGDLGSAQLSRDEIAAIRLEEAKRAAALLRADYCNLGFDDLTVYHTDGVRRRVVELLRQIRPDLVLTASLPDYMPDHEVAAEVVCVAAFCAPIPSFSTGVDTPAAPLASVPAVYYADPIEFRDAFGQTVYPSLVVDTGSVFKMKCNMLACHASQREWLRQHHGIDEYLERMRAWSHERGQLVGCAHGEGLRQHLGHGYPHEDLLTAVLGCPPVHTVDRLPNTDG